MVLGANGEDDEGNRCFESAATQQQSATGAAGAGEADGRRQGASVGNRAGRALLNKLRKSTAGPAATGPAATAAQRLEGTTLPGSCTHRIDGECSRRVVIERGAVQVVAPPAPNGRHKPAAVTFAGTLCLPALGFHNMPAQQAAALQVARSRRQEGLTCADRMEAGCGAAERQGDQQPQVALPCNPAAQMLPNPASCLPALAVRLENDGGVGGGGGSRVGEGGRAQGNLFGEGSKEAGVKCQGTGLLCILWAGKTAQPPHPAEHEV